MDHTLSAVADPNRANALVAEAMRPAPSSERPTMPVATDPPDTIVQLPGGALDGTTGEIVKEVEVRELNGLDEEILGRVPLDQPGRFFATVLKQGVVRVGAEKATPAILDNLLMGDRDFLLLAVRRVTWGNDVQMGVYCANCDEAHEYIFFLDSDVPTTKLEDPSERNFAVKLSDGREAKLHLPDGHSQTALLSLGIGATRGVLNTAMLASCVDSIGDIAVMGTGPIQSLSIRDRNTLLSQLSERTFGPQLGEVSVPCQTCGQTNPAPLSLGTLFQL